MRRAACAMLTAERATGSRNDRTRRRRARPGTSPTSTASPRPRRSSPICEIARRSTRSWVPRESRVQLKSRQGVEAGDLGRAAASSTKHGKEVPHDGGDGGRDRRARKRRDGGLLQRPRRRRARAFAGGYFHSGDAAVVHPDGYAEVRDRLKDVIISGGENISSVEVEGVLLYATRPCRKPRSWACRRRTVGRSAACVRDL